MPQVRKVTSPLQQTFTAHDLYRLFDLSPERTNDYIQQFDGVGAFQSKTPDKLWGIRLISMHTLTEVTGCREQIPVEAYPYPEAQEFNLSEMAELWGIGADTIKQIMRNYRLRGYPLNSNGFGMFREDLEHALGGPLQLWPSVQDANGWKAVGDVLIPQLKRSNNTAREVVAYALPNQDFTSMQKDSLRIIIREEIETLFDLMTGSERSKITRVLG